MSLQELLRRLELDVVPEAVPRLEMLADELLRWNVRRNLTAITDREEVLEKHLVDSLTLLPFARRAMRLLDIGSGAGFPALPLKIACPQLEVVSVDAVGKKVDFQRHAARLLGLSGFTAVHGRAETLTEFVGGFDLVTARALCSLSELVPLARPFLTGGGRLVAMKGREGREELRQLAGLLEEEGWRAAILSLRLPASGAERCLIEMVPAP